MTALVLAVGIVLCLSWGAGRWQSHAAAQDGGGIVPSDGADAAAASRAVGGSTAASQGYGAPGGVEGAGRGQVVVVRGGDTLWHLVARYGRTDRDPRDLVTALMEANGLASPALRPGMVLVIPPEVAR